MGHGSSGFRAIESPWDRLESVGHVAPFVAPGANCRMGEAGRRPTLQPHPPLPRRIAVQWLSIQEIGISHWDGIDREAVELIGTWRGIDTSPFKEYQQAAEVVGTHLFQPMKSDHRLEPLLDRLLGVKPNSLVVDLGVGRQSAHCLRVSLCLANENPCQVRTFRPRQESGPRLVPRSTTSP